MLQPWDDVVEWACREWLLGTLPFEDAVDDLAWLGFDGPEARELLRTMERVTNLGLGGTHRCCAVHGP